MTKTFFLFWLALAVHDKSVGQVAGTGGKIIAPVPPMGWMTWNYFADNINEKDIREMADAMVSSGMLAAGYQYVFIDDGWQGGRDNKNNLVGDLHKFPSGIKALAGYIHSKGLKLGIYSDAAQLTCAEYTGSLNFEEQDAKIFAAWGVDYLKYDYCNAPSDSAAARLRYKTIADALRTSGREITLGICEWGDRMPWLWAANAGGQLWRTTADVRDKWKTASPYATANELHGIGAGILDITDRNAGLWQYAGPGRWNDMDMLVVGLYGKKGPSGDLGGIGCSEIEYQSQMSLWCMMASPLAATNDIRNMNDATKRILLNKEIIAINQDALGKQAERKIGNETWNVFVKPLANGDYAVAILNRSDAPGKFSLDFSDIGLYDTYEITDIWTHAMVGRKKKWTGIIQGHETKVFRLKKQ
jgi:alpha-galactosidase